MGCTNLLCLPPEVVDVCYFIILLIATVLNALIALGSMWLICRRVCCRREFLPLEAADLAAPVAVVVPCYLPNEAAIIEDTIEHLLLRLEHDGPLTLHIVYNTPAPLECEARLQALDGRTYAPGRVLRVLKAEGSTSKAENLNLVLQRIEDRYVALYDADHHPDPDSLRLLLRRLLATGCDAVQGSTYIRNTSGCSVLANVINAEFFVTHFIYFPAMEVRKNPNLLSRTTAQTTDHMVLARACTAGPLCQRLLWRLERAVAHGGARAVPLRHIDAHRGRRRLGNRQ